ncbi:MAG: DUF4381 family protein [Verrucomicrobiota bacterium]
MSNQPGTGCGQRLAMVGHNPVGVDAPMRGTQGRPEAGQPWALGQNPVGIQKEAGARERARSRSGFQPLFRGLALLVSFALATIARAQVALPLQAPAPAASPTPQEIQPIAPPIPVFPYPMWMVVVAAVLAVLALGAIIWAVVHHIKNRPQPPPPTAREIALSSLTKLRGRITEVAPHPFSIEVSDVLRTFITHEFRLSATRQTSPEFLAAASASPRFSEADKTLLATFLEKSDLIKFARMEASTADSEQLLDQAVRFVEGEVPA